MRIYAVQSCSIINYKRLDRTVCLVAALGALSMPLNGAAQSPGDFPSNAENQSDLTFSPDGTTAYWTAWNGKWGSSPTSKRTIYQSRLLAGGWNTPEPVSFSSEYPDTDPFVSPDGAWLYFVSERPTSSTDEEMDANIWRVNLQNEGQIEPLSINSGGTEYSPVITESGNLYFASDRDGGYGRGDLYVAAPVDGDFHPAEPLGPAVNSPTGEWNLWVSPDDTEIVFEASSRATNVSTPGDLYYSWQTLAGWTPATPVVRLNTADSDLLPRMHPDGMQLFYTTAPIGGHAVLASANWTALRSEARVAFAPILLVANRSSHEVTFVDLSRGEVVQRVPTGAGPHLLSNVSDGRIAATGFGDFPEPHSAPVNSRPPFVSEPNSRLTLIDINTASVLLDTKIEDCERPHASWIIDNSAYVTCQDERSLAVVDLATGATGDPLDTRQAGSHVLSFDASTNVLATSNTGSGSVTLTNTLSGETSVVQLDNGSEGALAIDGRIWVANSMAGSVSIVDPQTGSIAHHADDVCGFPIAFSKDARNRVWVACFASAELVGFDGDDFSVQRRIKLEDQPLHMLVHPGRSLAYLSLPRKNAIAEIDLDTEQEIRRIPVGIEPDGLRWAVP